MDMDTHPEITPKQYQVLEQLYLLQARNCYSATIAEIATALGVSRPTVYEHLVALREKGLVDHIPGKARSLRLTAEANSLLEKAQQPEAGFESESLPFAGAVSAGYGIETFDNPQPVNLHQFFGHPTDLFILQVNGNSMINAGFNDGDYIICRHTQMAENGQIVVAMIEEQRATLKRFYRDRKQVRLMPENDAFEPILTDQCQIQAIVVGLLRRM